jgi:4-carboxymuconolactone decarboxylase
MIQPPDREGPTTTSEEILRRIAVADPVYCRALIAADPTDPPHALDGRSLALVRLGGSIAAGTVGPVLRQRVTAALEMGVTFDEVVGSLLALAPSIGTERLAAIAPQLARALDYDIDAALQELD